MSWAYCIKHKRMLTFEGFGSMGSFHSNYYSCSECGEKNIILLYDHAIDDDRKYFDTTKGIHSYGFHDKGAEIPIG